MVTEVDEDNGFVVVDTNCPSSDNLRTDGGLI